MKHPETKGEKVEKPKLSKEEVLVAKEKILQDQLAFLEKDATWLVEPVDFNTHLKTLQQTEGK
jgi:hypothetical protein